MCPSLFPPPNGMITYSPDNTFPYAYQTMATYSCVLGYGIFGQTTARTCIESALGGGEWSDGADPTCQGKCWHCCDKIQTSVFVLLRLFVIHNYQQLLQETLSTIIYVLSVLKPSNTILSYAFLFPTIIYSFLYLRHLLSSPAVTCPALPTVGNGQIIYSMDTPAPYAYSTVATYVCDTSYGVSGGEGVLFCGGDGSDTAGSWGTSMPTCERELYSSSSCTRFCW